MQHDIVFADSARLRPPAGHYSHTCTAAGLVFVSGQLPVDTDGKPMSDQPFERQAAQALANVDACLEAAGTDRSRLLQVRVYVTDMKYWPTFNQIYADWIGEVRPARAVAGVASLHYGLLLEIEAIALAARSAVTQHNREEA
ncbi:RidA family protein [Bradyrhizobium tropiciagri]|uniref:RidA family protein n=1 Tax=Bradyrhizobium tropiciagri TaxID=312253 RepID=UPI001BA7DAB8|nr:RidA family protein [Bradyrhizobium tropiciagri]MBR0869415.1 RidA family protein [Bradyrhizobium tropiciagri]